MHRTDRSTRLVIVLLLVVLGAPAQPGAQAGASCAEIDRLERATQQFNNDLDADVKAFTNAEVAAASLQAMKTITAGTPAPAAAVDLLERYRQFRDFVTETRNRTAQLVDLLACLRSDTPGCLKAWASRQRAAVQSWVQSLVAEGTQRAIELVDKAASIYSNYVNRSVATFQTGATNALGQCVDRFAQQASAEPVQPDPPPAPPAAASPVAAPRPTTGGGTGKGLITALAIAGGGAAVALATLAPKTEGDAVATPDTVPGAPAFNGIYDFLLTSPQPGGVQANQRLDSYVRISSGSITSTDGRLTGSVQTNGSVTMTSLCPFGARDPATYRGTLSTSGSGSGSYSCVDSPTYTWQLSRR